MEQLAYNMIVCTVTILMTLLVSRILLKHFSVKWRYYIWIVLLVRLLLPFDISLPFAITAGSSISESADAIPANITKILTSDGTGKKVTNTQPDESEIRGNYVVDGDTNTVSYIPLLNEQETDSNFWMYLEKNISEIFAFVWIFIALFLIGKQWILYFVSMRKILNHVEEENSERVLQLIQNISVQLKIRRKIPCYRCNVIQTPMAVGIVKKKVLLPLEEMSDEELSYILGHELMHISKHHSLIKVMAGIVQAFYWFNPVIFFMRLMLDEDMEIICDGFVVNHLTRSERSRYNQILLRCAAEQGCIRYVAGFSQNPTRVLKRRFSENMTEQQRKKGFASCLLLMIIMCASLLFVSWDDSNAKTKKGIRDYADNFMEQSVCADTTDSRAVFNHKVTSYGLGVTKTGQLTAVGFSMEHGGGIMKAEWSNGVWLSKELCSANILEKVCPDVVSGKYYSNSKIIYGANGSFYLLVSLIEGKIQEQKVVKNQLFWIDTETGYLMKINIPDASENTLTGGVNALWLQIFADGNFYIQDGDRGYIYNPKKGTIICDILFDELTANPCAADGVLYGITIESGGGASVSVYDEMTGIRNNKIRTDISKNFIRNRENAGLFFLDGTIYLTCNEGVWSGNKKDKSMVQIINSEAPGTLQLAEKENRVVDFLPLWDGTYAARLNRIGRSGEFFYCEKDYILCYKQAQ